jgi:hypothetical protein
MARERNGHDRTELRKVALAMILRELLDFES